MHAPPTPIVILYTVPVKDAITRMETSFSATRKLLWRFFITSIYPWLWNIIGQPPTTYGFATGDFFNAFVVFTDGLAIELETFHYLIF